MRSQRGFAQESSSSKSPPWCSTGRYLRGAHRSGPTGRSPMGVLQAHPPEVPTGVQQGLPDGGVTHGVVQGIPKCGTPKGDLRVVPLWPSHSGGPHGVVPEGGFSRGGKKRVVPQGGPPWEHPECIPQRGSEGFPQFSTTGVARDGTLEGSRCGEPKVGPPVVVPQGITQGLSPRRCPQRCPQGVSIMGSPQAGPTRGPPNGDPPWWVPKGVTK